MTQNETEFHHLVPENGTSSSILSRSSLSSFPRSSFTPSLDKKSDFETDESNYATVNTDVKCTTLPPNFMNPSKDLTNGAATSTEKFLRTLQNSRKVQQLETKKKQLAAESKGKAFLPAKLLVKRLIKHNEKKKQKSQCILDDSSISSCSTHSSSYSNIDDIVSTLQKMLSSSKAKGSGDAKTSMSQVPGDAIGEKLAMHHDKMFLNYDRLPKTGLSKACLRNNDDPYILSSKLEEHSSRTDPMALKQGEFLFGADSQRSSHRNIRDLVKAEYIGSTDDVSSLSSASQGSSVEQIYTLQPSATYSELFTTPSLVSSNTPFSCNPSQARPSSQRILAAPDILQASSSKRMTDSQPRNSSHKFANESYPAASIMRTSNLRNDNVSDTLQQLSGEDGYMVLSSHRNPALNKKKKVNLPPQDIYVDSTYDNVCRLMEAVRRAAKEDAKQQKSNRPDKSKTPTQGVTEILKPTLYSAWNEKHTKVKQPLPHSLGTHNSQTQSNSRISNFIDSRPEKSSQNSSRMSVKTAHFKEREEVLSNHPILKASHQSNLNKFDDILSSKHDPASLRKNLLLSQETDILHSHPSHSSREMQVERVN